MTRSTRSARRRTPSPVEFQPFGQYGEQVEHEEIRRERHRRDDEEAQSLKDDVAALPAERPEPVPGVVVRDRDEERSDRRCRVVEPGLLQEKRVDDEVDDVAGRADDAELDELLPVAPMPERSVPWSPRSEEILSADRGD